MTIIRKTSAFIVACMTLAACAPAAEEADTQRDAEALLKEVRSLAGLARASEPGQCKVLNLGPKPCGGFERHLIYSTEEAQEGEMLQTANEYNTLIEKQNEQQEIASTCEYKPAPRATLSDGMCVPVETASQ